MSTPVALPNGSGCAVGLAGVLLRQGFAAQVSPARSAAIPAAWTPETEGKVPSPRAGRMPATRRAFSLLEVLLASVILGGAVVVILSALSTGQVAVSQLDRSDQAQALAGELLGRAAAGELDGGAGGERLLRGVRYRWTLQVEGGQRPGLDRLRCRVAWRERGQDQTLSLERAVRPPGGAP